MDKPTNASLMPMRCFSCGTPIRHQKIIDLLESGVPMRDVFEEANLTKICCRNCVMAQPEAVEIQKNVAKQQRIENRLADDHVDSQL